MMVYKQPAFGSGILWGETADWTNSAKIATRQVRSRTADRWHGKIIDPSSVKGFETILAYGEGEVVQDLQAGPPGAWFYPPR